jgi:hypothetical protein
MATGSDDMARDAEALREAVEEALAELPGGEAAASLDAVDGRWLRIGLWLGLERPDKARHLLGLIGDQAARPDPDPELHAESGGGSTAADGPGPVPTRSMLLARAATLSPEDRESLEPGAAFEWAATLSPAEILSIGRTVGEMLAAGSTPDLGRGFGLAWSDRVRLPHAETRRMFREFTQLELTVASVLDGRDLRIGEGPTRAGGILGALLSQKDPREQRASAAVERAGEPGRLGLIALWNAWMALRYRPLVPGPLFELLVRPWVTIVGSLPEA